MALASASISALNYILKIAGDTQEEYLQGSSNQYGASSSEEDELSWIQDQSYSKSQLSTILDDILVNGPQEETMESVLNNLDQDSSVTAEIASMKSKMRYEDSAQTVIREIFQEAVTEVTVSDEVRQVEKVVKKNPDTVSNVVREIFFESEKPKVATKKTLVQNLDQGVDKQQDTNQSEDTHAEQTSTTENMSPETNVQLHKELVNELTKLLQDEKLGYVQKAKEFAKTLARRLGLKLTPFIYNLAVKWIYQHRYQLLGHLAAGVVGTLLFSVLAPLAGGGATALGVSKFAVEALSQNGLWGFLVSGLANGLLSGAKTFGLQAGKEFLRDSSIFGPMLRSNLLGFKSIQAMLSFLPERFRKFTPLDAITLLEINLPLAWSTGAFRNFTIGGMDAWEDFGWYKGLALAAGYGVPLVFSTASAGWKAGKPMLRTMFKFMGESMDMMREKITTNPRLRAVKTRTAAAMGDKPIESVTREDLQAALPAMKEDLKDPAVVGLVQNVFEDVAKEVVADFEKAVSDQDKKEPLSVEANNLLRARPPPSQNVKRETEFSLGWLNLTQNTKSAAVLSGALMFTALAARSVTGDSLSAFLPQAFGASAQSLANSMLSNAQEHINADMMMYHIISNTIGAPTLISKLAGMLSLDKISALKKLQKKIGATTKDLTTEKHPFIRQFFNIIIGRKIYSANEVNNFDKKALIQILKDAGQTSIPASAQSNIDVLRKAVLQLQEHNIKEIHRILFNAISTQLAGTVGTGLAMKAGRSLLDQWRGAAQIIVDNPSLATQAGLSPLEQKAVSAAMEAEDQLKSLDQDFLGITTPGIVKDAAIQETSLRGAVFEAAVSGMKKIEAFIGLRPQAAPLQRQSISSLKDAEARRQGYDNADQLERESRVRQDQEGLKALDQQLKEETQRASQENVKRIREEQEKILAEQRRLEEEERIRKEAEAKARAEAEAKRLAEEKRRELIDNAYKAKQDLARLRGFKDVKSMKAADAAKQDMDLVNQLAADRAEAARIRKEVEGRSALAKERMLDVDERVAKAKERASKRLAERDLEILKEREAELKAALEGNETLKELGFLDQWDKVKDQLRGQEVIKLFPTLDPTQDTTKNLDPELAKALDLRVLPLAFYAFKRTLEKGESGILASIGGVYNEVRDNINQAIDITNTALTSYNIARALLRTNAATKDSALAQMMPAGPTEQISRLKSVTDLLTGDPRVQEWIESNKVDLGQVVGKAFFKHVTWGTSMSQMLGEIAGVLVAGKSGAAPGAYVGQKTNDIVEATSYLLGKLNDANGLLPQEQNHFLKV